MPWRGPRYEGEFPTLGYGVAQWIHDNCAIPDREDKGEPFILTDEQLEFLVYHYALDPDTGRWVYERGSQLIRPRKWGKAPLTAAIVCAEAAGPVLFDRWDENGEPKGKPWPTPLIQCVACSEDQVANVWRVLLPMIQGGTLDADIPDTGDTRINLPNGRIEPVTASARSRVGQRTTFAVMDETQMWLESNGGHKLESALKDNLAGTSGRFVETCNAFDPVENSVAQSTFEAADPHVYRDNAPPPSGDVTVYEERDRVLEAVYGDSLRTLDNPKGWIDKQRIHIEIDAKIAKGKGDEAERMFLNRPLAQAGAAFNIEHFKSLRRPGFLPPKKSIITVGVDGARHDDALAMIATDLKTGFQWPLDIIERPVDAGEGYEHDQGRADGAMVEAMERWVVWRVYIDPQHIEHLVEKWSNRYGTKRINPWLTYRNLQIAHAVREYENAISARDLSHNGDATFEKHIRQARKRFLTVKDDQEQPMHTLCKDAERSPRKMDAAMAGLLSWKARSDAIELGIVRLDKQPAPEKSAEPERPSWQAGQVPALTAWGATTPSFDGFMG